MIDVELTTGQEKGVCLCVIPLFDEEIAATAIGVELKRQTSNCVDIYLSEKGTLQRYLYLKLGAHSLSTRIAREKLGAAFYRKCCQEEEVILDCRAIGPEITADLLLGFLLVSWRFNKHRAHAAGDPCLKRLKLLCNEPNTLKPIVDDLMSTCAGVFYARDLTSRPPNQCPPEKYAQVLLELTSLGVQVEILDQQTLIAIGLEAIASVGQGSANPPCVAILSWKGTTTTQPPVALVGKGICFDSGGICLKSKEYLYDMKWDKAGAGIVAGVFKSLALKRSPAHIVGVLGLAENMPDGKALKPGDVVNTLSGQTIEITDTDAEGRLVLADCLWYVQERFNPSCVIDLGTLTVETIAALGHEYAGLYANNRTLANELIASGIQTSEQLWELPMGASFAKQIESDVADMRNSGIDLCGENGAAAEFLKRFIKDIPWAHIDISGVSWSHEELPLCRKGVTGFGVRLLLDLLHK